MPGLLTGKCDMGSSKADEKILSYNDVVLRRSDLHILSGPYFLNDRVIEFYFSHLESTYPSDDILLLPPSIAFWIGRCQDKESISCFVEPMKLGSMKLIIFPVNNNVDVTWAEGGSHWSLLAFDRNANIFVHHDSNGGTNSRHAKQLHQSVVDFVGCSGSKPKYVEHNRTPQQVNGYDCGLYVCAIARAICSWYTSRGSKHDDDDNDKEDDLWFSTMEELITPSAVAQLRSEILGLIQELIAAKQDA